MASAALHTACRRCCSGLHHGCTDAQKLANSMSAQMGLHGLAVCQCRRCSSMGEAMYQHQKPHSVFLAKKVVQQLADRPRDDASGPHQKANKPCCPSSNSQPIMSTNCLRHNLTCGAPPESEWAAGLALVCRSCVDLPKNSTTVTLNTTAVTGSTKRSRKIGSACEHRQGTFPKHP